MSRTVSLRLLALFVPALLVLGLLPGMAGNARATADVSPASEPRSSAAQRAAAPQFRALLFTKTAGYRHASIPAGVAMFEQAAQEHNFEVVHTEDASVFNPGDLATFDVVIMFQTSGMVWTSDAQRQAFQDYLHAGGGIVAVHNATDMNIEDQFPWWDEAVNAGAHMTAHSPGVLEGTALVSDHVHPSTEDLPSMWVRNEEWYNFDHSMRGDVHTLVSADETTYNPGSEAMGYDHPISWCRGYQGGRIWSTGMGHPEAAYTSEPLFEKHLLGGVKWAAGVAEGDCGGTQWGNFEKVSLDTNTVDPMELDVADDGRVLYIQRAGEVQIYQPESHSTVTAGTLDVYTGGEDGLIGMALDPNFTANHWIYLYYSPADAADDVNRLSRFTIENDTLVMDSEKQLLDVPAYRARTFPEPGHTGGSVEFGPGGDLYLSTGDDTPPNLSPDWQGYAPIDWREGKEMLDAARTAGNTNDLRGKILRIHPEDDGSYTIPAGNMFPEADDPGDKTFPEIYAMGFRNPFRFSVDPESGWVYVADYGPDRGGETTERGPAGFVEYNVIKEPGNYGWPFCHGKDFPYAPYNPDTGEVGEKFDCAKLTNPSPNNTGLTQLPPAKDPIIWYGYETSGKFPEMGAGGSAPMAGPVYQYDPDNPSETKFPAYYDGAAFFYEWSRNFLAEIRMDGEGGLVDINPFLPTQSYKKPMDMVFGPDGSLYLLEWGTAFGGGNNDSGLYRIDYVKGSRSPIAKASASPVNGQAPLEVRFSSEGSNDPDPDDTITYAWDFDGDGTTDSTEPNPTHTYTGNGNYTAQLVVTDSDGKTAFANIEITVGNTAPAVTIDVPPDGGMIDFGDRVAYEISASDPEDAEIDCRRVLLNPALGHDDHEHATEDIPGCAGVVDTGNLGGHPEGADLYYALNAEYTDTGGDGVGGLTGYDKVILQPKHKQAEYFSEQSGIRVVDQGGAESGSRIGDIAGGDWISFDPVSLSGIQQVQFRVSSPKDSGGTIELRLDAPDGPLVAEAAVPNTGDWDNYQWTEPVQVNDPGNVAGTHTLYVVFQSDIVSPYDLDSLRYAGPGVAANTDKAAPETSAATEPSEPNGENEWFNGPVTATLKAADEGGSGVAGTEYRIGGQGSSWKPYTAPFTVESDGQHTVSYRSADQAGNVESTRTLRIQIDSTVPEVTVGGLDNDAVYGDSEGVQITYEADDATSGVTTVTATLDSSPIESGQQTQLSRLALGGHALTVTATDTAGNATRHTVAFTTRTSPADVAALLERFHASGGVTTSGEQALAAQLDAARRHAGGNRTTQAVRSWERFTELAGRQAMVPGMQARTVLLRDAGAMIDQLSEGRNHA